MTMEMADYSFTRNEGVIDFTARKSARRAVCRRPQDRDNALSATSKFISAELKKWHEIITKAGITAQ